nr:hypothetical protein Iba_scaffold4341CG0040 [Ipomoea batatas]GME15586.1 hypothetical protein Iba_scaffold16376CG0010 [Ipomoea batatas]
MKIVVFKDLGSRGMGRELTVGNNLPALVVSFCPFPENDCSPIVDTAMVFVTMECIHIEANVVDHPDCLVVVARVMALAPHDRFIKMIRIVWDESHLKANLSQGLKRNQQVQ